jgi:pimeloyl-ACP methyl ester carboxylesterase
VIGVSLGAMVAQLAAARQPDMIRSLTLIMTGTGDIAYLKPRPQVLPALLGLTASDDKEEQAVARGMAFALALAGPAFPVDRQNAQARLRRDYRRAYRPFGVMRQICAVLTQGSRSQDLAVITAPTEILHGSHDPIFNPEGARQAAAAIKGARLTVVEGMGHDFGPGLVATAIQLFLRAATRLDGVCPVENLQMVAETCP